MKLNSIYHSLCEWLRPASDSPSFEAFELLRAKGYSRETVLMGAQDIPQDVIAWLNQAVSHRLRGYPLQYLLQEWDFYGRTFTVGEGVLIPRADTETLVDTVLDWVRQNRPGEQLTIADLCAGTGCVGITLALELPNAEVICVEKDETAFQYLEQNIARYPQAKVHAWKDDVLAPENRYPAFDSIVSNPPYICAAGMAELQREVQFEPRMALEGGPDGLLFYSKISALWKTYLRPGGLLAFEIGKGQDETLIEMLKNKCFKNVCTRRDLCDIIRVISGESSKTTYCVDSGAEPPVH